MTSDGGVMRLGETDRKLGLLDAAARCIPDPRNPLLIKHAVRDMLRQRVYGLALGWEDLIDHRSLREDVAMQTAIGMEREVASAPTLYRLENWADKRTAWRLHQVLVDQFIASFKEPPQELVLDFDATGNPLHGRQEGRFFHGYYDCYCYLPLYVFCGQQLLCAYLTTPRGLVQWGWREICRLAHAWGTSMWYRAQGQSPKRSVTFLAAMSGKRSAS